MDHEEEDETANTAIDGRPGGEGVALTICTLM